MWLLITSKQPRYRVFKDRNDAITSCCSDYSDAIVNDDMDVIYSGRKIVGYVREFTPDDKFD